MLLLLHFLLQAFLTCALLSLTQIQPCRLLPLAISCIYEVTFSSETYAAQIEANAAYAADSHHRALVTQLQSSLFNLRQAPLLNEAYAKVLTVNGQDQSGNTVRSIVWRVKYQEPQTGYMGELQHAWQFSIGAYNDRQAGNCLFWLFEEPSANRVRRQDSRSSSAGGNPAALALQNGANPAAEAPHAAQHASGMQPPAALPLEHSERRSSFAGACRPGSQADAVTGSNAVSRSAAGQQSQIGHVSRGSGWKIGHVVLVAATAIALGVLVGSSANRMNGLSRKKRTITPLGVITGASKPRGSLRLLS